MSILDDLGTPEVSPLDRRRKTPLPPIPHTGWKAPTEFPNLSGAKVLSFDTETYDPELLEHGPGWARGKGHMVGLSVAVDPVNRWYFPMRHEVCPEENLDPQHVLAWARDTFGNPNQVKVGANLIYDVGWMAQEGVAVRGPLFDVQFAEALLTEDESTSLESMSDKYLGSHKETTLLYDWIDKAYKPAAKARRAHIYQSPPSLVGFYGEADASLPLELWPLLSRKLVEEELYHIMDLECSLIPFLVAMRFRGVRVDLERAEQARIHLLCKEQELSQALEDVCGFEVQVNSPKSLQRVFDSFGIAYPRTEAGAPSFKKDFLERVEHPVGKAIVARRNVEKLRSTFVEKGILQSAVNGRIHCSYHPLRGEEKGTRSGRFSASNPNLQQIPSRDEELAPIVRGIFVPDYGHKFWRKHDYGQIEYRLIVHYAVGAGAEEARALFAQNPSMDYHEFALGMVAPVAGWDLSTPALHKHYRKSIKTTNFGLAYGMGEAKLARTLGLSPSEASDLFAAYHAAVPFVKATMGYFTALADRDGFVRTYLGRKRRFLLWERDGKRNKDVYEEPLPYQEAVRKWGKVRRHGLHKALNTVMQGSSADMMKLVCVRLWNEGVFSYTGLPTATVHDELDFSDSGEQKDAFAYVQHVMENIIPLRVPVEAGGEIGPDWGHCKTAA